MRTPFVCVACFSLFYRCFVISSLLTSLLTCSHVASLAPIVLNLWVHYVRHVVCIHALNWLGRLCPTRYMRAVWRYTHMLM